MEAYSFIETELCQNEITFVKAYQLSGQLNLETAG